MPETIQEFVNSGNQQLRVDREAGILRGVKLLGLSSENGRRYRNQALSAAIPLYEGSKVNVNHPKGSPYTPRDYQDRIGCIRKVEFKEGAGLFGELHFNPKHVLSEQLVWDAENEPANVGFSHNVLARTSQDGKQTVVEAITKVHSVDLVADPATTKGLFEHRKVSEAGNLAKTGAKILAEMSWDALTLEHLKLHRPDLVASVQEQLQEDLRSCREQLDQASVREATALRREKIMNWLTENRLPLPGDEEQSSQQIVSRQFIETLLHEPCEATAEQLVVERANLVRSAQCLPRNFSEGSGHPLSRESLLAIGKTIGTPQSAEEFASLIQS